MMPTAEISATPSANIPDFPQPGIQFKDLQTRYDLEMEKDRLGDRLDREVTVFSDRA